MSNTERSFSDKWINNPGLFFDETLREDSDVFNWILRRNGFQDAKELRDYLAGKRRIMDAGCGNGRVTALLCEYARSEAEVVGVDLVSSDVARHNLANYKNVSVLDKDITADLSDLGQFDFIYCQEVLHHTPDPGATLTNLCQSLNSGGEIAIYVYKVKGPVREFTDEYVRGKISNLSYDEACAVCEQLTRLGKALAECKARVKAPRVDVLGIEEGEYDIQRLVYHFFAKLFWNPEISFADNRAINYDWYHPQTSSKHTLEEVRGWFKAQGLNIVHECVDHYGITVRGQKTGGALSE